MVDLLSTNETYFFREPGHFDFLRNNILPDHPVGGPMRVWSAASSSGEEAYSIAMLLGDVLGKSSWEIFGSDISTRVLEKARRALYPLARHEGIPEGYLKRFCLRGKGPHEGSFLINTELRDRVRFAQINLNKSLPELGEFNVIFLRNVLIYFDFETKQKIINRLGSVLSPGGYLFIGHTENLQRSGELFEDSRTSHLSQELKRCTMRKRRFSYTPASSTLEVGRHTFTPCSARVFR